jgi:hypothetical protein
MRYRTRKAAQSGLWQRPGYRSRLRLSSTWRFGTEPTANGRDKFHRRALHRLGDRLRIAEIVQGTTSEPPLETTLLLAVPPEEDRLAAAAENRATPRSV